MMPLIVVSGLPTSGKTTRAKQLEEYFRERIAASTPSTSPPPPTPSDDNKKPAKKYNLHYISDGTLSISRAVYDLSNKPEHARSANSSEKDARASLYGAVKRVLSDRDVVILDSGNYIKGWRYQLHCEAKAMRTPSCVLQIGCKVDVARGVNDQRLKRRNGSEGADEEGGMVGEDGGKEKVEEGKGEEPYEPENWENLVFRYEEPNGMNRWDSPLFTLVWDDDEKRTREVFEGIWDAVAGEGRKVIKPNQATVQRSREASGDYLYVLDRETQGIVKSMLEQQGDDGGGTVKISRGGGGADLEIELPMGKKGLPQLQRLRRAFMGLNRGGIGLEGVGTLGVDRLRESFVGYLNDTFEKED